MADFRQMVNCLALRSSYNSRASHDFKVRHGGCYRFLLSCFRDADISDIVHLSCRSASFRNKIDV